MPDATTDTGAAAQPRGTPPHGGRWAWGDQAAEWKLLLKASFRTMPGTLSLAP